jgi:uncharacterized membrane protein YdcZ (DUF606 family)
MLRRCCDCAKGCACCLCKSLADQIKHKVCGFVLWVLLVGVMGASWIFTTFETHEATALAAATQLWITTQDRLRGYGAG